MRSSTSTLARWEGRGQVKIQWDRLGKHRSQWCTETKGLQWVEWLWWWFLPLKPWAARGSISLCFDTPLQLLLPTRQAQAGSCRLIFHICFCYILDIPEVKSIEFGIQSVIIAPCCFLSALQELKNLSSKIIDEDEARTSVHREISLYLSLV